MIELIGGGARSGKSAHALLSIEQANQQHAGKKIFIATASADDASMCERIERHQAERDNSWSLIEEPLQLSSVVSGLPESCSVVIDCLTLWVTNWLCADDPAGWQLEKKAFLDALSASKAHIVLVTNEVGHGVIPMGQLSRDFIDESGWLHQEIATQADRVVMMQFGIPQILKSPS